MSGAVDTYSGPKLEIKIEETAIPAVLTPNPGGGMDDVEHEGSTRD